MDTLLAFIPVDRQLALASATALPGRSHGAALFADLSGFTPLTAALVRALGPQRGAEELTRQLNLVYDALIGKVDMYRGAVIGFSGDAITCWFDGDSGTRALTAALEMQREMQKFSAVSIPNGGAVALALKAAVVSGQVRRFTVGDPKIQLIDVLAGTTLDRLAETEHHADKGEVVIDGPTALTLGADIHVALWKAEHKERYAVVDALNVHIAPRPWQHPPRDALRTEDIRPWLLPAVFARLNTAQPSFLAELRPAVSLFMRFGGIDFELDPDAGSKLDGYVRWVQSVVNKYDGILVQLTIGDKGSYLYAAFGAPIAHDDDAARALRAAIELQSPPRAQSYITPPQIGISRGRMRVGPYGGTTRRTYGVLGDEVNVAARLMQSAQPGQILVTERVVQVAERAFEFERLDPIRVKGKSEPLRVLSLSGPRAQAARSLEQAYDLPVVGRVKELEVIQQTLDLAASGHGQVLALLGEAGIGKSRLAHEAMRRATRDGFEPYRVECPSFGTNNSYLVWHTILRQFFHLVDEWPVRDQIAHIETELRAINPNLVHRAPLLGAAMNLPIPENELTLSLDARMRKQLVEELVLECVRARAMGTPLAFLVEDAHWIDALSHDLLEAIGRETWDRPVLIVVTLRPPDIERMQTPRLSRLANTTSIELGDFTAEDAAQLIALRLARAGDGAELIDPMLIQKLTARAGGNPFYIEELLNYMRDRGLDPRDMRSVEALDLPDSLSSLILSRIDRLSEPQRSTLKVASIIGRQFLFRWLWGVYPMLGEGEAVQTDLDDMSRLDLTPLDQPDPQRAYIFRHVLTHQVTYESQPYALRAELHGHFGHFLEEEYAGEIDRNVDLLAHHFDRSEEMQKRRAYLLQAAEQAQAEYANDAAISYYQRLLSLLQDDDKVAVMLKLGQVYEVVGEWDRESALFDEGLKIAARLNDRHGNARLCAAMGTLSRKRGEIAQSAEWLEQARRGFDRANDSQGIADVLKELGTLAIQQGDYDQARKDYQESLQIYRVLGDKKLIGNLLSNLGILARMKTEYENAESLYVEALALRREIGDRWGIAASLNNLGMLKRYQGKYLEARALLQESLSLWRQIGDRAYLANTLTSLGEVSIDQRDAPTAREMLTESLTINRGLGDKRAIAILLENFARIARLENDTVCAVKLVSAATALRQSIGASLPETERKNLDAQMQAARAQLGDVAFDQLWDRGKAMTMEQAIAYALGED